MRQAERQDVPKWPFSDLGRRPLSRRSQGLSRHQAASHAISTQPCSDYLLLGLGRIRFRPLANGFGAAAPLGGSRKNSESRTPSVSASRSSRSMVGFSVCRSKPLIYERSISASYANCSCGIPRATRIRRTFQATSARAFMRKSSHRVDHQTTVYNRYIQILCPGFPSNATNRYEWTAFPRGSVKIPRVWSLETPPPDDGRQGR